MKKIIAIILSLSIGTGAIICVASREKIDVSNNDTTFVTNADKVEETTSASNEVSTLMAEEIQLPKILKHQPKQIQSRAKLKQLPKRIRKHHPLSQAKQILTKIMLRQVQPRKK